MQFPTNGLVEEKTSDRLASSTFMLIYIMNISHVVEIQRKLKINLIFYLFQLVISARTIQLIPTVCMVSQTLPKYLQHPQYVLGQIGLTGVHALGPAG